MKGLKTTLIIQAVVILICMSAPTVCQDLTGTWRFKSRYGHFDETIEQIGQSLIVLPLGYVGDDRTHNGRITGKKVSITFSCQGPTDTSSFVGYLSGRAIRGTLKGCEGGKILYTVTRLSHLVLVQKQ